MKVGPYEIQAELGAGGMGRVRLARDPSGRLVVLKSCLRDDADDDERLRDEARVGLRLRHPGVVETVELLEVDDERGRRRPVLVTAFVQGMNLLELRRCGPLPPSVVCRLGRQLGAALDAIHGIVDDEGRPLGVLHRDVTAANCLLGDDGEARLIDFGIARARDSRAVRTDAGLVRGTLRYLAPEVFAGAGYSVQSDLWSLGVVLFEALVGRPAVNGNDVVAMGRICVGDLTELLPGERPDPRVLRAIARLLQKRPEDRPGSARDVAAVFAMHEKALAGENGRASGDDARAAVFVARARVDVPTEAAPVAIAADETSGFLVDVHEQPFSLLPPTEAVDEAAVAAPPSWRAPHAGRTAADDLREYAASLLALENRLHHVEEADASADAAARARSAILQDTALWAPRPALAADVALLLAGGDFALPPETTFSEWAPSSPPAAPSSSSPESSSPESSSPESSSPESSSPESSSPESSSPESSSPPPPPTSAPPRVFDGVITADTPARARGLAQGTRRADALEEMLRAFLRDDGPSASPPAAFSSSTFPSRRALVVAGAPLPVAAPPPLLRLATALWLIGFGTIVAVIAAALLR
jgi:hypothetical protein